MSFILTPNMHECIIKLDGVVAPVLPRAVRDASVNQELLGGLREGLARHLHVQPPHAQRFYYQ
jgi:hypothetical protein